MPQDTNNTLVDSSIVISDIYLKNSNNSAYTCSWRNGTIAETCLQTVNYDSIKNEEWETDKGFEFQDDACCEDGHRMAICCTVGLNQSLALR